MNKSRKIISCLVMVIFFLVFFFQFNIKTGASSLSVQPMPSENQYNKNLSYFDLKLGPNQEEILVVKLSNSGKSSKRIKIFINHGGTNKNGEFDHVSEDSVKRDHTLKYDVADLVKYKKEVEIPAEETIDYDFTIKAPSEGFSGLVVGGISFSEVLSEQEKKEGVDTETYLVGIILHGTPDKVKSDMKLTKVYAGLDNSYITLFGNLENPTASFINHIDNTVKVYAKSDTKKKTPLYEDHQADQQMAPNSNFDYNFKIGGQKGGKRIRAGEYVWVQDVKSSQGTWHFEKNFEITAAKARELNAKDVTIEHVNIWLYVAIGLASLLLLLLIIWIVRRQIKAKKELKRLREEAAKARGQEED